MKRIPGATVTTQHCLNYGSLEDVLGEIPQEMIISSLRWRCISGFKKRKLHIPGIYKKLGVTTAVESSPMVDCGGSFRDMTRKQMILNKRKVVDKFGLNPDKFQVLAVTVVGSNGPLFFQRVRKSIGENGDAKKVYFLGLVGKAGQRANEDVALLNANKVACQSIKVEQTVRVCSTVV